MNLGRKDGSNTFQSFHFDLTDHAVQERSVALLDSRKVTSLITGSN